MISLSLISITELSGMCWIHVQWHLIDTLASRTSDCLGDAQLVADLFVAAVTHKDVIHWTALTHIIAHATNKHMAITCNHLLKGAEAT